MSAGYVVTSYEAYYVFYVYFYLEKHFSRAS